MEEQPCWPHTLTTTLTKPYIECNYGEFKAYVVCSECGFEARGIVVRVE